MRNCINDPSPIVVNRPIKKRREVNEQDIFFTPNVKGLCNELVSAWQKSVIPTDDPMDLTLGLEKTIVIDDQVEVNETYHNLETHNETMATENSIEQLRAVFEVQTELPDTIITKNVTRDQTPNISGFDLNPISFNITNKTQSYITSPTRVTENYHDEESIQTMDAVTFRMLKYMQTLIAEQQDMKFNTIIQGTDLRNAVKTFYQSLVLTSNGYLHLQQSTPYGDISVSKGANFYKL